MKKTLIALMALASVAAAEIVRNGQIWSVTFGTDIDGSKDYLVTNGAGSSYAPSGVWDVEGQTGTDYVFTNGSNKRVHIQGDTGLSWSDNFEFEIVFVLPQDYVHDGNWPVLAELSGDGASLRFGPYTNSNNEFQMDGTLSKDTPQVPVTLSGGSEKHTATVTLYEGSLTLKLDGVVAQTGMLSEGASGIINNVTLGGNSGSSYRLQENVYSISAYKVTEVVPEPTTAALSLFALVGLTARRRRK